MIVVPVLMINCQVSLKPNMGPVMIHTTISMTAEVNTRGRPEKWAVALAKWEYQLELRIFGHPAIYINHKTLHDSTLKPKQFIFFRSIDYSASLFDRHILS